MPNNDEPTIRNRRRLDKVDGEDLATTIIATHETQIEMAVQLNKLETKMDTFIDAFPEGDMHGHKMYHASLIKRNEEQALMYANIKDKTLAGLALLLATTVFSWIVTHISGIIALFKGGH